MMGEDVCSLVLQLTALALKHRLSGLCIYYRTSKLSSSQSGLINARVLHLWGEGMLSQVHNLVTLDHDVSY